MEIKRLFIMRISISVKKKEEKKKRELNKQNVALNKISC